MPSSAWVVGLASPLLAVAASVVPLQGAPLVAAAQPMQIRLQKEQVVLLYLASNGQQFIERDELLALGVLAEPLSRLPKTEVQGCYYCINLAELSGRLTEHIETASAVLHVAPQFVAPQLYNLDPSRRLQNADAPYLGQPGSQLNYQVLAAVANRGGPSYGGLLQGNQGLPGGGLLRSNLALLHSGNNSRALLGETYIEQPLLHQGLALRVGDSRGPSSSFFGSSRILGAHLFSRRELRDDLLSNPYYQYSFEARAPGVVEIFRDGVLTGRQNIEAGTVTLQDLPASRQGDVRLVVRNVLGEEQVIYAPLFTGGQYLRAGQWEGGVSAGVQRDSQRTGPGLASGSLAYGLSSRSLLSASLDAGAGVVRDSLGFNFGSRYGQFVLGAAHSRVQQQTALLGRADWRYQARLGGQPLEAGLTVVQSLQPTVQTLASVFATRNGPLWSLTGSAYSVGSITGLTLGLGRGRGAWSAGATAGYSSNSGGQLGLRLTYTPPSAIRAGASVLASQQNGSNRLTSNLGYNQPQWRTEALFGQDFAGQGASYQLLGGYQYPAGSAQLDSAQVNGVSRHSLRVQGGMVFDGLHPYFTRSSFANGGYAVINTQIPGAEVQVRGQTALANGQGVAVVAVPAYQPLTPSVRYSANGSDTLLPPARLLPGQQWRINAQGVLGYLLQLPRPEMAVSVNGVAVPVLGLFAQLDGLHLGHNDIRVDGVAYTLQLQSPKGGVLVLDTTRHLLIAPESP